MDYDELKQQGEELAKGKTTDELARLGFVYSFINNHLSTLSAERMNSLLERMKSLERIVYATGVVIVVALIIAILSQLVQ